MAMVEGEIYRCSNDDCGCEIQVLKGPAPEGGGGLAPRCCCGALMDVYHAGQFDEALVQGITTFRNRIPHH